MFKGIKNHAGANTGMFIRTPSITRASLQRSLMLYLMLMLASLATVWHAPARALEIGQRVQWPDFPLTDNRTLTASQLHNRYVFLQVWASWCPYCKMQNASLPKLQRRWEARGGAFLTVATDKSAVQLRAYLDEKGYQFPVAHATADHRNWLGKIKSVPTVYVLGPDGSVLKKIEGQMLEEDLLELADLLPGIEQNPSGGRR